MQHVQRHVAIKVLLPSDFAFTQSRTQSPLAFWSAGGRQ